MAHETQPLRMPRSRSVPPMVAIGRRVAIAVGVVLLNWVVVLLERDGYRDAVDGHLSAVDALYYTTVTLSTTGYGDITPVTTSARLTNALVVTPMRFIFVLVLVGTTIQVLTKRSRDEFKVAREQGVPADHLVVVDPDPDAVQRAAADGLVTVQGSATSDDVMRDAEVGRARAVVVAVDRDDAAVLATLTVRQLAPHAVVAATVREEENADLLVQSGATSVITSSDAAGRLLGIATESPHVVSVVEDLIAVGSGLDLRERVIAADEVGRDPQGTGAPVVAVVRDGRTLPYDDAACATLRAGDRVIYVASTPRQQVPEAGGR